MCTLCRASQIPEAAAAIRFGYSPHEHAFGDDTPGRWAWLLQDVERLDEPSAFGGSHGSFDVPDELFRSTFRNGTLP
jgi:hypothetical protein